MTETTYSSALQNAMAMPAQLTRSYIVNARSALTGAARLAAGAKRPTQIVGEASLRMNRLAHDAMEQLIRQQVRAIEGFMDEGAQRLQLAAEAGTLRSLVNEQVAMFPETRARLVKDVRATLDILGETRLGMTTAIREEIDALRQLTGSDADADAANEASAADTADVTDRPARSA